MRGRPLLFTSYEAETSVFPTGTQRIIAGLFVAVLILLPFDLPVINQIPFIRFLGDNTWLRPLITVLIFAVAALGLNILTGVSGQVSLGHAFFMGVGAYTAVVLGGEEGTNLWGWGLPIWIWLPGAGVMAALVGLVVAPTAVRLRGLYLGIVTLGLVFIGLHLSRMLEFIAGPGGLGRSWPALELRLWKEEEPLVDFASSGKWFWFEVTENQKTYLFCLGLLLLMTVLAKNVVRTRTGRALQAIRDRDVAAEIMGVPEVRYKLIAFAISSFFAGVSGAVFASFIGQINPEFWGLFLSVQFIAILLIGGAGTVAGTLIGAFFVVLIPEFVEAFTLWLQDQTGGSGLLAVAGEAIITDGPNDFGAVSVSTQAPGWPLSVFDWNFVLYGALIVIFQIFEPLGLYGLWIRVRNYFKGWPFSY